MKINAMRAFLISALVIILLYTLGLFLPIIMNSKDSRNQKNYQIRLVKFEENIFNAGKERNSHHYTCSTFYFLYRN